MNCPNCGNELPEGISFCSNCGTSLPAEPAASESQAQSYSTMQSSYGNASDSYQTPYQQASPAPAKKKAPVGAIIGAIVALAAIACIVYFVFLNNGDYNGKYVLVEMTYNGFVYDEDTLADLGQSITLTVKGNRCDLEGENATFKIKGDKVTLTDSTTTYEGTYDKSKKTITMDFYGATMVFKKQ